MPSLACKCVFYRPELNANKGSHVTEFGISWNTEMKYTSEKSSNRRW